MQCRCTLKRKGCCIAVNAFLYFNSKVFKRSTKKLPMGEKSKSCKKNLVKLPYSAKKVLLRALILILFFVLIFNQGGGID